jgi:hypothetical protein
MQSQTAAVACSDSASPTALACRSSAALFLSQFHRDGLGIALLHWRAEVLLALAPSNRCSPFSFSAIPPRSFDSRSSRWYAATMPAFSLKLDTNHLTVLARAQPRRQSGGAAIILCNIAPSVNATASTEHHFPSVATTPSELRSPDWSVYARQLQQRDGQRGVRVPLSVDWSVYVRQLQPGCRMLVPSAASLEPRPKIIHRSVQSATRSVLLYGVRKTQCTCPVGMV